MFLWVRLVYLVIVLALGIGLYCAVPADVKQAIVDTYFRAGADVERRE